MRGDVSAPVRVQLSRAKDWRMLEGAVKVDRTTRWGNPYTVGEPVDMKQARRWGWEISPSGRQFICQDAGRAVRRFAHSLAFDEAIHPFIRSQLGGKNLACWCRLCPTHKAGKPFDLTCHACAPCHSDPLGRLANALPHTGEQS